MSSIAKLFLGAAAAFAVAVVSWLAGLEAGGFLVLRAADELCGDRVTRMSEHLIPMSSRCTFTDGTTRDLVPAWVNPAVGAGLAGAVVLGLLAMRAANRP
jgi:hypothetical protein